MTRYLLLVLATIILGGCQIGMYEAQWDGSGEAAGDLREVEQVRRGETPTNEAAADTIQDPVSLTSHFPSEAEVNRVT